MHRQRRRNRDGSILVLAAFLMIALCGFVAFAVDLGYLCVVKTQLQRSADASAMAAVRELYYLDDVDLNAALTIVDDCETVAATYAGSNTVTGLAPGLAAGDVEVGRISDPLDPDSPLTFGDPTTYNAVRVTVQRTASQNGQAPLFFARVFGLDGVNTQAQATAVIHKSFSGWKLPSDGTNLGIVPIALDEETWLQLLAGNAPDDYTYDPDTGEITAGADGLLEVDLYPHGTGSPGNRGTVDIGVNNNSTSHLGDQIRYGVTEEDLSFHGGSLEFDGNGELLLGADPGISNGIKDDLAAIVGEPRIIPIFRSLSGNGNNAVYTIVKFVGVRLVHVHMTGNNKHVFIQPAKVLTRGGITTPGSEAYTDNIYSPVTLAR
jgi:Flp pilus assembly protein TadG